MSPEDYGIIIAGGRDFTGYIVASDQLRYFTKDLDWSTIVVISGRCDVPGVVTFTTEDGIKVYGADGIGERIAKERGWRVSPHPADWEKYGKAAGPIRNTKMAQLPFAKAAIIFHDGKSKGTSDMILRAVRAGLHVEIIEYNIKTPQP